jgi:hypothetical protein
MTADFYIITSDHGHLGMSVSDPFYNLDDATDELAEAERLTGRDARAVYVDVASGYSRDVTPQCLAVIAARRAARGNVVEWYEAAE